MIRLVNMEEIKESLALEGLTKETDKKQFNAFMKMCRKESVLKVVYAYNEFLG